MYGRQGTSADVMVLLLRSTGKTAVLAVAVSEHSLLLVAVAVAAAEVETATAASVETATVARGKELSLGAVATLLSALLPLVVSLLL